jgi:ParB family transcriptional regulator, chromosome partitioning protein
MVSVWNRIEIKWVETERCDANPWNPNRMESDKFSKLRAEIKSRGLIAPLLVRPVGDRFQIVDGEHRWRIARELGLTTIPCVIVELPEFDARIKTLQLNGLRGDNEPDHLAALLSELARDLDGKELEQLLPWSAEEMDQMIALLGRDALNEPDHEFQQPPVHLPEQELFAVVLTPSQREEINRALAEARRREKINDDGEALAAIGRAYLVSS